MILAIILALVFGLVLGLLIAPNGTVLLEIGGYYVVGMLASLVLTRLAPRFDALKRLRTVFVVAAVVGAGAALIVYAIMLSVFDHRLNLLFIAGLYGGFGGIVFAVADALTIHPPKREAPKEERERFLDALERHRADREDD